jgi:HSP20 family molecular chaperone IbpA
VYFAWITTFPHNNLMKFSVGNFNPDEVKISCKDGVLTAQGERQKSEDGHEVRESFFRQMTVPTTVDVNDIQCFRDGDGN